VAAAVGVPGGARAVGAACGSNPVSIVVPCHRVVAADGGLGGYAWGLDAKHELLEREGAR
jgi:O-6-methylguanine DNA methyltransferase